MANNNGTMVAAAVALAAGAAVGYYLSGSSYSFRDRVVLITGGSRGLGLMMARELAEEGAKLALVARDPAELHKAVEELTSAGAQAIPAVCDIRDPQQVASAVERVLNQFGRIDVLINNAGIIQVGPIDTMSLQDYEDAMAVHFYGPLHMIQRIVPIMRKQEAGRIVNIASIGGEVAVPHLAPYCASKYALVGLSDSLRAELWKDSIIVTTVCPWLMRTGSYPHAVFKGQFKKEYAWFGVSDSIPGLSLNAERAARQILNACRHGKSRITVGWPGKLAVFLNAVVPGLVATGQDLANWLLPDAAGGSRKGRPGWQAEREGAPNLSSLAPE